MKWKDPSSSLKKVPNQIRITIQMTIPAGRQGFQVRFLSQTKSKQAGSQASRCNIVPIQIFLYFGKFEIQLEAMSRFSNFRVETKGRHAASHKVAITWAIEIRHFQLPVVPCQ